MGDVVIIDWGKDSEMFSFLSVLLWRNILPSKLQGSAVTEHSSTALTSSSSLLEHASEYDINFAITDTECLQNGVTWASFSLIIPSMAFSNAANDMMDDLM